MPEIELEEEEKILPGKLISSEIGDVLRRNDTLIKDGHVGYMQSFLDGLRGSTLRVEGVRRVGLVDHTVFIEIANRDGDIENGIRFSLRDVDICDGYFDRVEVARPTSSESLD